MSADVLNTLSALSVSNYLPRLRCLEIVFLQCINDNVNNVEDFESQLSYWQRRGEYIVVKLKGDTSVESDK